MPRKPPSSDPQPSVFLTKLGRRLAQLRVQQGLELADLALMAGITAGRLKKIESGAGRLEASLIYDLSRSMNVKVADLFEEASDDPVDLFDPETRELMRFFGAIKQSGIRRSILKLAKALSEKP